MDVLEYFIEGFAKFLKEDFEFRNTKDFLYKNYILENDLSKDSESCFHLDKCENYILVNGNCFAAYRETMIRELEGTHYIYNLFSFDYQKLWSFFLYKNYPNNEAIFYLERFEEMILNQYTDISKITILSDSKFPPELKLFSESLNYSKAIEAKRKYTYLKKKLDEQSAECNDAKNNYEELLKTLTAEEQLKLELEDEN